MAEAANSRPAGTRRQLTLLILAAVFMAVAVGGFLKIELSAGAERERIELAGQFALDAGAIEVAGRAARPDFAELGRLLRAFDENLKTFQGGGHGLVARPLPDAARAQLDAVAQAWAPLRQAAREIVADEKAYTQIAGNYDALAAAADGAGADYDQIAGRLSSHGSAVAQVILVSSQRVRLEQIKTQLTRLLGGGRDAQAAAETVARLAAEFTARHRELMEGGAADADPAVDAAGRKAQADFAPIAQASATIGQNAVTLGKLQAAAAELAADAAPVQAAAKALEQSLGGGGGQHDKLLPYAVALSGILALVCLAGVAVLFNAGVRQRLNEAEAKDAQQQQAILNLLDEITNLANGDLTVDVTVTEDFTGAIADSINYTVQTLRGLVGTINSTSEQIVASAASTQDTAQRMSQASDQQAKEITAAAAQINATSTQLQEVAGRAERIAVQAQTSVQIAHNGASTVGRTIQNMAALREQIQDTAKRIKRLGESSQEIGNIIEFINDIAEQTNTLALNASIQAAMAGEAGRGFAVVADEVQRLAERAGSATRQIENLVKTIQADTNEAIISMERSTSNVVAGAKSAEEAGQALTRIESSSQDLAKSIQEISVAARGQSAEATKIADTMQGIREIAVQTSQSANTTSHAVGELNTLSDQLRESVAGFKLPGS
ncbi:MAG: methyl-accepting chemotaxis protein [Nevskia sp.]|nr:methyl-accepting chemotaxis protein [Nevskia sp.]